MNMARILVYDENNEIYGRIVPAEGTGEVMFFETSENDFNKHIASPYSAVVKVEDSNRLRNVIIYRDLNDNMSDYSLMDVISIPLYEKKDTIISAVLYGLWYKLNYQLESDEKNSDKVLNFIDFLDLDDDEIFELGEESLD